MTSAGKWFSNAGRGYTGRTGLGAILCALLALATAASPAYAAVYRCVGANGHVTYQETSCNGMVPGGETVTVLDNAWPVAGKHIFWKAESSFGRIYLLGSLHFGAPWIYPLPAVIGDALASADVLVVEANTLEIPPETLATRMEKAGVYQDETRLKDVLTPTNWDALVNVSRTFGQSPALVERQKPWFASMTLTSLALRHLGYSSENGVDLHLMREAAPRMPIVQLESVDSQINLLNTMSQEEQVAMLMQSLHEIDEAERYFGDMLEAWLNGDAEKLDRVLFEGFDRMVQGEQIYQRMITERNVEMMNAITPLTRKYDTIFVVVGAGHLVGADGLVERMKSSGYKVEQL